MGDVAMTVPVLRAFSRQYPSIKITFVSRPFFKPIIDTIENVNFFSFDDKIKYKGFIGLLKLFRDLKKLDIDAFVDLHNVLRSIIIRKLFVLNGTKVVFTNKGRAEKKALTRSNKKVFKQLPTVFERHLQAFQELGFTIDLTRPIFPEKSILDENILELFPSDAFLTNKNLVGIAPFAQHQSKVYPLDLMSEVITELAANENNLIFLFGGGKSETEQLERLSKVNNNVISVAGKLKFASELKLISNLNLMLSMDSGNAHIAAMFGVKVVTLWGATHPFAGFSPFNQPNENALISDRNIYPKIPTSVYGNKKVVGYENAMRTILPENVVKIVMKNLYK
jgi:ADP-heptose:LPS heptosyltransferase